MKRIIKVASILSIVTLVKIISGLLRAKFMAWQLGPAGLGIVGQALMYSGFTIQLCSLNMAFGITKGVSESLAEGRKDRVALIVDAAWTFQLLVSTIFIICVLPFSAFLAGSIFSDVRYWPYVAGLTMVTPFALYLVGMTDPVFFAFKKIGKYTKLMVTYTLISLCLLILFVFIFKTSGVIIQIVVMAVVGFAISYHVMRSAISLRPRFDMNIFRLKDFRSVSSDLFQYGLVSLVPANINMVVMLSLRGILMRQFGVEANGFYQVAYSMSCYYLPFVTNGIWGHFYPLMCSLRTAEQINREINIFIRFALLVSTSIAAGCIIFRKYIIDLLFSQEFMNAYSLLAIQAVGDIFFVLFCIFSTALMARKKFKGMIWISTIGYNIVLIAAFLLMKNTEMCSFSSLNLAIGIANISMLSAHIIYARIESGMIVDGGNRALFLKTALFVTAILLMPEIGGWRLFAQMALFLLWLGISVNREEAAGLKRAITAWLGRGQGPALKV